jgi:hypothetical protein
VAFKVQKNGATLKRILKGFEIPNLNFLKPELRSGFGMGNPIYQNAIKQGECGNLERDQTERDRSELDKANILADPDFAQTDFAQIELAKNHVLQIWNPINHNLKCNQTTKQL